MAVGGHPVVEIMIPLTVSREELALARRGSRGGAVAEAATAQAGASAARAGQSSR